MNLSDLIDAITRIWTLPDQSFLTAQNPYLVLAVVWIAFWVVVALLHKKGQS